MSYIQTERALLRYVVVKTSFVQAHFRVIRFTVQQYKVLEDNNP